MFTLTRAAIVVALSLAITAPNTFAQATTNWLGAGGNGLWSTAANWDTSPVNGDFLQWTALSTLQLATQNDLLTNVGKLAVTSPATNVSIAGNAFSISGDAGIVGIDLSAATRNLLISANTSITANQFWLAAAGTSIAATGTLGLGANTLSINNGLTTGTVLARGVVSGTSVSTAISMNAGTLVLLGANTYTGQTIVGPGSTLVGGISNAAAGGVSGVFGVGGVGNEVIVQSGGSLNLGGVALSNLTTATNKLVLIQGTGVGGLGALYSGGLAQNNALHAVTLSGNATVASYGSAINVATVNNFGRMDIRPQGFVSGAQNLNLAGFTLTKIGGSQFSVINSEITPGAINVNDGLFSLEGGVVFTNPAATTITVTGSSARLGFFIGTAGTVSLATTVNLVDGGALGETSNSTAVPTLPATTTFNFTGGPGEVHANSGNGPIVAGPITTDVLTTSLNKRGAGTFSFSNIANAFTAPININQGTLRGIYSTALVGGVAPATPVASSDTPFGAASALTVAGGTIGFQFNAANDGTNQVFTIGRSLIVDRAPGTIAVDRVAANTAQTDKNLLFSNLTFAPSSAANGFSIGQNQLTGSQLNNHRTQYGGVTFNNDTVFNAGDFTFTDATGGNSSSGGITGNSFTLIKTGGNSYGFVGGTHTFSALFNTGNNNLRIGDMFGTGLTSNTVTAGSGPIFMQAGSQLSLRSRGNIAAGQIVDLLSQATIFAHMNMAYNSVPAAEQILVPEVRTLSRGGVYSIAGASAFQGMVMNRLGDGFIRLGAFTNAAGAGTIVGPLTAGKPALAGINLGFFDSTPLVRLGAGGTLTVSAANAISGNAGLEVGASLVNGAIALFGNNVAQSGTIVLTAANAYTGGTTVNRGSTLNIQAANAFGTGSVSVFGTLTASLVNGSLTASGTTNNAPIILYGGSTLFLDNSVVTGTITPNRFGDNENLALVNSTFTLSSRNDNTAASPSAETVNGITFNGGNTLNLNRTNAVAGNNVRLNAASLARVGLGTLEITRTSGTGASFSLTGSTFNLTAAPTPVNGIISPFITVIDGTRINYFATYSGAGASGFVTVATPTATITTGSPAGTFTTGLLATGNYYTDFASANTTLTLGDNPIINTLKLGGGTGTTNLLGTATFNSLTLRAGGMIISHDASGTPFSTDGTRTVNIGSPAAGTAINITANDGTNPIEFVVNTRNAFTANFYGTLTATGFTKSGAGTWNFHAASGLAGTLAINAGAVQSFGPTATGTLNTLGTGTVLLAGGALNFRSNNSAVNAVAYTVQNSGITALRDVPLVTVDVARSSVANASGTVDITINPAAVTTAATAGLVLQGAPGPQGQTFTLSGSNGSLIFGNNIQNHSFTGNVTINNGLLLQTNYGINVFNYPGQTNPVITKSGAGTFRVGVTAALATQQVAANTTLVVNAGTLELRTLQPFGTGPGGAFGSTRIVLNAGTLALLRDSAGTYGGAATSAYPVSVNGNSTINVDRSGSGTNIVIGLGRLTINNSATATITSGNTYIPTFLGATLNGFGFVNTTIGASTVETGVQFLSGSTVIGGGLVKQGTGFLHLLNANNPYDGGTYIQGGYVRARATNTLGTGAIVLNPGAVLDLNSATNIAATQTLTVNGSSAFVPMISMNADVPHPTANVNATNAPVGIVGLSNTTGGTYNTTINLATLYGGNWYLGGVSSGAYDARYTATSLGAGNGNVYRLGGGGNSLILQQAAGTNVAINNLLTGTNSVQVGFDSGNILPNVGSPTTNFQLAIGGVNNYTGPTVIHRGNVTRLMAAPVGGFTGLSNTAVSVFGSLILAGNATLDSGTGNINAVTLHPGATLTFDNLNGAGNSLVAMLPANNTNRWNDLTPINLDGALLNLIGVANGTSSETVGPVTISRGARIRTERNATGPGNAFLTLGSLAGLTAGNTLTLQTAAASTLGGVDRVIVAVSPPNVTNGMVDPRIINSTDNTFVTYGANGFANINYSNTFTGGTVAAGLAATATVDVGTAAATLQDSPTVYALRTSQAININGPFDTVTLRSGGLVLTGAVTHQAKFVFNDGTQNIEARIFSSAAAVFNNTITANGVTKFGNSSLQINQPQPAYAQGWTVNAGTLIFADLLAAGQSTTGNAITINAINTTGGSGAQAFAASQVTFNRDTGSPELATFTSGPITVVNEGVIRIAGTNDRNLRIANVTALSTSLQSRAALTLDVPNNRFRAVVPTLTLLNDTLLRVIDVASSTDTGRITTAAVNSLVGANVNLSKIGNRTLELNSDNSTTFTGGSVTVSQGTLRVRDDGALGSATTNVVIERNAALEIAKSNFVPTATIMQNPGSIERWNVPDARGPADYTLPAGVNLQLNTNINGRTVKLTGGTIEAFLYSDHVAPASYRTIGSSASINLLADSFIGQNVLQGAGYDLGRQPTVNTPFANVNTGSTLEVAGNITGNFTLTKTGFDTVFLSGDGNTFSRLFIDMGVVRTGRVNTLPAGSVITPRYAGILDLNGFAQTVAGLGVVTGGPTVPGTSLNSSGKVTDSAPTNSTLTVDTGGVDYTFTGTIERTIALTKTGMGVLTLANPESSYINPTRMNGGTLEVPFLANGGFNSSIGSATSVADRVQFDGGAIRYTGGSVAIDRSFTVNTGGATFDISTAATTLAISGSGVAGTAGGGLAKIGPGTLSLAGVQTYTGETTITAGTLTLTGGGSIAPSTVIRVNSTLNVAAVTSGDSYDAGDANFTTTSGQTLRGTGTVSGNSSIGANSTLRAGNSIGTLTFNNNLKVNAGSTIFLEIGNGSQIIGAYNTGASSTGVAPNYTSNNHLNILGNLTFASVANTNFIIDGTAATFDYSLANTYSYYVAKTSNDLSAINTVLGSGFVNFNGITADTFTVTLFGTATGDLILSFSVIPVPEPSLIVLAAAVIVFRTRRSRTNESQPCQ